MGRKKNSIKRMLEHHVQITDSCWIWTGSYNKKNGYSKTRFRDKHMTAHKAFYLHYKGELEVGMHIDHLCKNILCVNPEHLEQVTPAENNRRSNSATGINSRKIMCIRGHELNGENLYLTPDGRRQCRKCGNFRNLIYRINKYNGVAWQ